MKKLRGLSAIIVALSLIFTMAFSVSADSRMVAISDFGIGADIENGEVVCDFYVYTVSSTYTLQVEIGLYDNGEMFDYLYVEQMRYMDETFSFPAERGHSYYFDIYVLVFNSSGNQIDELYLDSNTVTY